jgi:hypothetical protein
VVIRVPVRGVKFSHRQAQGATLMKVQPGDFLVSLASLGPNRDEAPSPDGASGRAVLDGAVESEPADADDLTDEGEVVAAEADE